MDFISKFKETLTSVLPVFLVVMLLNFTVAPLGELLAPFIIGTVLLIAGLSLFLAGTDIGMVPIGEKLGSTLAHKRNTFLMLAVGFLVGFGVTFAEPDVNVLASQVHSLNPAINETTLVFMIAVGLGLFVDIGLMRVLKRIKLKYVIIVFYCVAFALVGIAGQKMASISFDASGATTGPLAVPFLLALGLGVSSASKDGKDSSFGLTGIASIGPVIAVAAMAIMTSSGVADAQAAAETVQESATFGGVLLGMVRKTAIGFGPLAGIILVLQFTLLHFPKVKFRHILFGIVYSFIGIVLFLTGVEYGFTAVGGRIGEMVYAKLGPGAMVALALVFGAIVVCAEPAVWVLTKQVETVTAGRIRRKSVLIFLCIGVACAVALSMVRIFLNINYLWFVYIGVGISLVLTFFCPPLFTGIAFDSGGVASGPMSTSFLLAIALGVSGSAEMGFGLVGLIAISPLIAIQVLGIIFKAKERKAQKTAKEKEVSHAVSEK